VDGERGAGRDLAHLKLVLTERHGEQVSERELAGEREWRDCLLERFGVALI
jgi:hypothetical protein